MMVFIDADEMYPVYYWVKTEDSKTNWPYDALAQVPDDVVSRWEKVEADWRAVQKELKEYCK